MPFFYSISLVCSVIGFHWINGNHLHGSLNSAWWPVGEESQCALWRVHIWAWGASCMTGILKVIIWFIAWAGGLGLLWLGLLAGASWVQIWTVCISTNKWSANNEGTSPWPESVTRELYRSSGRITSHSPFKEPCPWQWGGREKQCSRIT